MTPIDATNNPALSQVMFFRSKLAGVGRGHLPKPSDHEKFASVSQPPGRLSPPRATFTHRDAIQ